MKNNFNKFEQILIEIQIYLKTKTLRAFVPRGFLYSGNFFYVFPGTKFPGKDLPFSPKTATGKNILIFYKKKS